MVGGRSGKQASKMRKINPACKNTIVPLYSSIINTETPSSIDATKLRSSTISMQIEPGPGTHLQLPFDLGSWIPGARNGEEGGCIRKWKGCPLQDEPMDPGVVSYFS
ncbi:hypothetical protein TNIN_184721 [Trichonephila inaurata madagascariensis]|uniref:Uncharacterized protein n=1 Tax=Trichonephila inaurata madagascariensis TaxID=2747483 RepID=A0A8X6MJ08_9ARAC|nr:hypothetical protein TNIN_184721 [Trichonephila inaurata madagascariensis]